MKLKSIHLLAAMALLGCACWAQAALTCTTPVSTGFSTAIDAVAGGGASVVPNVTQGLVTFSCSRSAGADALSVLLRANDGIHATGVQNRAQSGVNVLSYEAYKDSACGAVWTSLVTADLITVNLAPILSPPNPAQNFSISYWGCITVAPVVPAGAYTDTVSIRIRNNTNTASISTTGTFPVSIVTPATCSITSIQSVAFGTYLAFRNTPLVAPDANIVLNCTPQLPYTMSFDAALGGNNGVVGGLNYSLTINTLTPPVNSRGTGPGQTHTINGTMPANQAGTCTTGTCGPSSQTRTLTITY